MRSARAEKLRRAFGLTDESPLKDRNLRNELEHFDERLDEFLIANEAGHFFPYPQVDTHELADNPTAKIFKLVDLNAHVLVLLNKKHFFAPVVNEVSDVMLKAIEFGKQQGLPRD